MSGADLAIPAGIVLAAAVFYHLIDRTVMANRSRSYSGRLGWTLGAIAYTLALMGILYGRHEIAQRAR